MMGLVDPLTWPKLVFNSGSQQNKDTVMLSEARVGPTYFTIILQSSVGTLETHFWVQVPPRKSPHSLKVRRHFSESSESSKSVRVPVTLYVLYRHWDPLETFRERSADFEIVGRFYGRHPDPEVSL
jgi:hypothetical protein